MMKDLIKIADFLDKNGRTKDANLIDYISSKYAGDDLGTFFKKGLDKDFIDSEFGRPGSGARQVLNYEEVSREEAEETEALLNSLMRSFEE